MPSVSDLSKDCCCIVRCRNRIGKSPIRGKGVEIAVQRKWFVRLRLRVDKNRLDLFAYGFDVRDVVIGLKLL